MRTRELISLLVADRTPAAPRPVYAVASAVGLAAVVSASLLVASLGVRPDLASAAFSLRFLVKAAIVLILATGTIGLVVRLSRPEASPGGLKWVLILVPIMLALAVVAELVVTPSSQWESRLFGLHWLACLMLIPLFALPPLAALLYALKQAAPRDGRLAGAVAGLASGAIGASIYVLHCPDDSPLFLAAWYTIAIGVVAIVGCLVGKRWLRW